MELMELTEVPIFDPYEVELMPKTGITVAERLNG
jgi:hypothetical protein